MEVVSNYSPRPAPLLASEVPTIANFAARTATVTAEAASDSVGCCFISLQWLAFLHCGSGGRAPIVNHPSFKAPSKPFFHPRPFSLPVCEFLRVWFRARRSFLFVSYHVTSASTAGLRSIAAVTSSLHCTTTCIREVNSCSTHIPSGLFLAPHSFCSTGRPHLHPTPASFRVSVLATSYTVS